MFTSSGLDLQLPQSPWNERRSAATFAGALQGDQPVHAPIAPIATPWTAERSADAAYVCRRISGRERTVPIGYFAWDDGEVISFSSARWWVNLRDGRRVRLRVRGQWRNAVPAVAEALEDKVRLLREFVTRHGPRTARRLYLGLPGDREPTQGELVRAAERTAIVRFRFS